MRAASPMDVKLKSTGLMPPGDPRGKRGKSPLAQPSIVTLNLPEGDRARSKTPDIMSEEELKKKRERIMKMEVSWRYRTRARSYRSHPFLK